MCHAPVLVEQESWEWELGGGAGGQYVQLGELARFN